uniref:Uncharacterized protein n=1 Tax=Anguilla anguilla TaxID=7936 RepID=A0A0E9U8Y4_ANGAN
MSEFALCTVYLIYNHGYGLVPAEGKFR